MAVVWDTKTATQLPPAVHIQWVLARGAIKEEVPGSIATLLVPVLLRVVGVQLRQAVLTQVMVEEMVVLVPFLLMVEVEVPVVTQVLEVVVLTITMGRGLLVPAAAVAAAEWALSFATDKPPPAVA